MVKIDAVDSVESLMAQGLNALSRAELDLMVARTQRHHEPIAAPEPARSVGIGGDVVDSS
jgi:hypothetical protein